MNTHTCRMILFLAAFLCRSLAHAEDIDLFKGNDSMEPAPPNILIFLDNTSNWSANNQAWDKASVTTKCAGNIACLSYVEQIFGSDTKLTQGEVEVSALSLVLNELVCAADEPANLNIGIMMVSKSGNYTNNAGTATSSSGISGFIRRAVLHLDAARCTAFLGDLAVIRAKVTNNDWKAPSNANYGGPLFDAFKYFGGYSNPAGTKTPTGHIGFGRARFGLANSLEDSLAFDETSTPYLTYKTPVVVASNRICGGKNYILLVGNTYPNADESSLPTGLGYSWTPSGNYAKDGRLADVWAKFMASTDISPLPGQQTIQTFVMNVFNASADVKQTALLQSMAQNGNGSYYEVGGNLGLLIDSFRNFFASLNAANRTLAPAVLPSGLQPGGLNLNQVYLGLFRPDKNPRWFGNLKLYQLALNGTLSSGAPNIYIADSQATPIPAICSCSTKADCLSYCTCGCTTSETEAACVRKCNGSSIDTRAISFWTSSSSFWNYRCGTGSSTGDPLLCGIPTSPSDSPDGAIVEKGGVSQKVRLSFTDDASNSGRTVHTDTGGSLTSFNTTNITAAQLGLPADVETAETQRISLINWIRGVDNIGENTDPLPANVTARPRPSIIGDVLHSEPVAVNYGAGGGCSGSATGNVVLYFASNHGMLHAITGGASGGAELWSYIPGEFLPKLNRLKENTPTITYPAPVPLSEFNKDYLIDGGMSVYAPDLDANCVPDKVWLYISMRRGGRFLYALDVTNRNTPSLLWKKSYTDTDYAELGQTWSKPKVILLPDGNPYLIFGAGYDPAAEDRPFNTSTGLYGNPPTTTRGMGKGVFIVDAATGAVKKFLATGNFSVPSDVAVVANSNTGYAERAYVGDTGGDFWKITLPGTAAAMGESSGWAIQKMASLGDPTDLNRSGVNARAFLYPPDVARCAGGDVVLIGSGDREEPYDRTIQNRFFMIQDNVSGTVGIGDLTDVTTIGTAVPSTAKGWYFNLGAGEKTVGSAVTQSGSTYFPTNEAVSNYCSASLGNARMYGVSCSSGGPSVYAPDANGQATSRYDVIPGGGFPPSPTTTVVQLTDQTTGVTKTVSAVISGSYVTGGKVESTKRRLNYWYRDGID
jgi:type IV pilus assembly protein PilY1